MADMPKIPYVNLKHHLGRATTAHRKVHQGISDHAERERAARRSKADQAKLAQPLKQITADGTDSVPAANS
jgi:hypothetical protein